MRPHTYADNPLDRSERWRHDETWLSQKISEENSRFLPFNNLNVFITNDIQPRLGWITYNRLTQIGWDDKPIFLGILGQATYFAADISNIASAVDELSKTEKVRLEDARTAAELLTGPESGILAQAKSQVDWHNRNRFCSSCGGQTEMRRGGHMRKCTGCGVEHFSRTDPVIIVVVSSGTHCLLGQSRGRLSRMNMYSALAGFVDQAETIEEAVTREVMEEAGIKIENIQYHSSQPWPFPWSLMIGCHAEAVNTDINMDTEEMIDVKWFPRKEIMLALKGKSDSLTLPGPLAIAHHLIKSWALSNISKS